MNHLDLLHLPFLTLSPSLHLLSMNRAARTIFGDQPLDSTHAACMFTRTGDAGETQLDERGVGETLRDKLERLAHAGDKATMWGRGLSLEYWVGEGTDRKAYRVEAVVQSFDDTSSLPPDISAPNPWISVLDTPLTPTSPVGKGYTTFPFPASTHPFSFPHPPPPPTRSYAILFVRPLTPVVPHSPRNKASGLDTPETTCVPLPTCIPLPPSLPPSPPPIVPGATPIDDAEVLRQQLILEEVQMEGFFDGIVMGGWGEDRDFKRIFEQLPQICTTASRDGRLSWFSSQWYEYCGISRETSLSAHDWLRCFHVDDMIHSTKAWATSTQTGEPYDVECRVRRADGEWRWNVVKGRPVMNAEGEVESWVCTITEVEELVKARSDALKAKEHIKAALAGADIVLFSIDLDSIVTYFEGSSAVGGPAMGVTQDQNLVGQALRTVWPDEKLEMAVYKILNPDRGSVQVLTELNSGALADGHCYRYRLVPLNGGPGVPDTTLTGITIIAADVSKLAAAEEALHQSRLERSHLQASECAANEASRLKTEFVTNISHEIRTPIATVIGICELLIEDITLMDVHRSLVVKSLRSGQILLDLVGMVLDYGKVEAGKLSLENAPFYMNEAVADAELFSVTARQKGVHFEVEERGNSYTGQLMGDRLRLWQVIANVLSNSVKFTTQGRITLSVEQTVETAEKCVFQFVISDTGIGIDPSVLSTLFIPFRQADTSTARRYGGSGLGLALSKCLVEMMGGTIQLESVLGEGTTMTVMIPLNKAVVTDVPMIVDDPSPSPSMVEQQWTECWPKREDVRILLAEDNDLIREIVTRTLQKMKFSVTAVEDGNAALRAIEERDYDLILMDGQMPGLDGYEATRKIRQLSSPFKRRVKIIALTASAVSGDRERCISAGMDGYLAKPVRAKELEAAIWEHLAVRVPVRGM